MLIIRQDIILYNFLYRKLSSPIEDRKIFAKKA